MNSSNTPFFTIITSTFNAARTLPRLLNSLASQTCQDFVWVMQDGASQDNSLTVAKEWQGKLPYVSLQSTKDTGIYDAWNKAIERQGENLGQWVLFLGADDELADVDVLEKVKEKIQNLPTSTLFAAGDVQICDEKKLLELQKGLGEDALQAMKSGSSVMHSGLFTRGSILNTSKFDTTYAYCGDHDFVLTHWGDSYSGKRLDLCVTKMFIGGVTSNFSSVLRFRYEFFCVMKRHYGLSKSLPYLKNAIKAIIPYILQRILGETKAQNFYNWQRKIRKLPPATIK